MADQAVVVGSFQQREAAYTTLQALHQAGFRDDQLGFMARQDHQPEAASEEQKERTPNAVLRGIVGGIMGAADILLAPFTGPADANLILESTLPVAEEAIDRLPYPGSHAREQHAAAETTGATGVGEERPEAFAGQGDVLEQQHVKQHERTSIVTGGIVGGTVGALGSVAALLVPGVGPIVAGGILAVILGGAGMGSIAGGFLGAFTDIGIPEHSARHYEQEVKAGSTVVTVKAEERQQEAAQILKDHGAHNVQIHMA